MEFYIYTLQHGCQASIEYLEQAAGQSPLQMLVAPPQPTPEKILAARRCKTSFLSGEQTITGLSATRHERAAGAHVLTGCTHED